MRDVQQHAAVAMAALLGILAAPHARANPAGACPESAFRWGYAGENESSTAAQDVFDLTDFYWRYQGAFNLVAGTLSSRTDSGEGPTETATIVSDEYRITGLPAGTPVSFAASLRFDGRGGGTCREFVGCADGRFAVTIREAGTANVDSVEVKRAEGVVLIPITTTAETPFVLELSVRTRASGYAGEGGIQGFGTVSALLHFRDLPPLATVASCHGFAAAPVPARPRTWGELKLLYR